MFPQGAKSKPNNKDHKGQLNSHANNHKQKAMDKCILCQAEDVSSLGSKNYSASETYGLSLE